MRLFTRFLRSRVALACVGVVLIGGVSGALAAVAPSLGAHSTGSQTLAPAAPAAAGRATATATAIATFSDPASPTSNGTQGHPTATPRPQSQPFDLHGSIVRVDTVSGSLALRTADGTTQEIVVNAGTRYSGAATDLRGVRTGMLAETQGNVLADGTYLATQLDTQPLAASGSGQTPIPVLDN